MFCGQLSQDLMSSPVPSCLSGPDELTSAESGSLVPGHLSVKSLPHGSFAAPLKRSGQFPSMMVHMVAVGERSGQLEAMLENVASAYERDVEGKVARLTTVLSPLIIVVMALVVVFIVFSVLQPILDMQNFVQ